MQLTLHMDSLLATSTRTENLDAYSLYTRGSAGLQRRTPQALLTALEDFKHAAELDSSYAPAYVGIADTYNMLGSYDYGALDPEFAYPHARVAALQALRLNSQLDRAHAALATAYANHDWKFRDAAREFETAIRLNPGNSAARQWYALMLASRGDAAAAIAQSTQATRIDPTSPIAFVNRAHVQYYAGHFDSATVMLDKALEVDRSYVRAHLLYVLVDLQRGRIPQAIGRLEPMLAQAREPALLAVATYAYARAGVMSKAMSTATQLDEQAAAHYVPAELRALAAVGLQQRERALDLLEEAYRRKSGGIPYLAVEPMMQSLRNEPRFQRLVAATRS
jgi:tetratricopeptide (TPR) repeat protein